MLIEIKTKLAFRFYATQWTVSILTHQPNVKFQVKSKRGSRACQSFSSQTNLTFQGTSKSNRVIKGFQAGTTVFIFISFDFDCFFWIKCFVISTFKKKISLWFIKIKYSRQSVKLNVLLLFVGEIIHHKNICQLIL